MSERARKPVVYLLIGAPILLLGGKGIPVLLLKLYARIHGITDSAIPNRNGFLIGLPAFFLWIPLTFLLANCVLFAVPPLRAISERYVAREHRPSFYESQRQLIKMVLLFAAVCLPLIALGFIV